MEQGAEKVLKQNNLSITDSRKRILEIFLEHTGAMSHSDIEKKFGEKIDRVTVYRTLQTFLTKGIIHNIPTSDNSIQYALCKSDCSGGHHHDNHVHFVCDECGVTTCLDEISTPNLKLPQGFKPKQIDVVVNGICNKH